MLQGVTCVRKLNNGQQPATRKQNMKNKGKTSKKDIAPTVAAIHETKQEVQQIETITTIGKEIIVGMGRVAEKYRELVVYIRENKVAPKTVSGALLKLGFKRSRVSEVNRVANASDALFSQYEAKLIGLDKALEIARNEVVGDNHEVHSTQAAALLTEGGVLTTKEVETEVGLVEKTADKKGAKRKASKSSVKSKAKALANDLGLLLGINLRSALPFEHWVALNLPGASEVEKGVRIVVEFAPQPADK